MFVKTRQDEEVAFLLHEEDDTPLTPEQLAKTWFERVNVFCEDAEWYAYLDDVEITGWERL